MTDQTKIPAPEPVAQVQRMGSFQGVPHYGCLLTMAAERRMKVNDPLYGSAELETYAAAREAAARQQLVAAWNDLPDELRCHPGLSGLFAAIQKA